MRVRVLEKTIVKGQRMVVKLEDVIGCIGAWTKTERDQLRVALGVFDRSGAEAEERAQTVWSAFRYRADLEGIPLPPFPAMRRSKNWPQFRDGCETLDGFVTTYLKPENKTERVISYQIAARALLFYFREINIPVSVSALARNMQNIPDAVDRCWPGYAKKDKLRFVLTGKIPH